MVSLGVEPPWSITIRARATLSNEMLAIRADTSVPTGRESALKICPPFRSMVKNTVSRLANTESLAAKEKLVTRTLSEMV